MVFLFASIGVGLAAVEPAFVFEDQLRFTLSSAVPPTDSASFLIFSKVGTISEVSVNTRNIKTPDGQSLPNDAAIPTLKVNQATEDGTSVSVKLNLDLFQQPGEYRITLICQGKTAGAKLIKGMTTLVVVRPAAEINVEELKDQTFQLVRSWPWGAAKATFPFSVQEVSGKSDLHDLDLSGQGIYVKETRERVPGSASVTPAPPATVAAAATSDHRKANFELSFADLEKTGAFETTLVVNSPRLGGRKLIPLRLNVTDCVFWPFIVICLGVGGGFWTNSIVNKWRPRQVNRSTILRLRGEVGRFRQRVNASENSAKVESLWARLRIAEESNETGDVAQVKPQLQQIENDLDEFRKSAAIAQAETQKALNNLKSQVQVYPQQVGALEADEESGLQTIEVRLADVQWLLRQGFVDDAEEKVNGVKALFAAMRKRRLTRYIEDLETLLTKLKLQTTAADQAKSEILRVEARTLLNQNQLDDVQPKLDELSLALKELSTKVSPARGARGPAPVQLPVMPKLQVIPRSPSIRITTAPDKRTTDIDIAFEILDPGGLLNGADVFRWNFGEPGSQQDSGTSTSYRYREYGDYEIRVDVTRDGQIQPNLGLTEQLKILPGRTERARLTIRETIQKQDVALSLIALVLASLTGLLFLYVGKNFGSLSDYLLALFWGFGIDNSVRGFAGVMGKLNSGGGVG